MSLERIEQPPMLAKRSADSHKGLYGSIFIIAGSRGMAGAAALAGAGALRSGAGLVRVASPTEVQPIVASFEPSYMTYPLPQDDDGLIAFEKSRAILQTKLIPGSTVLAMGPGLGQSTDVGHLVRWALSSVGLPTILDADALNVLAGFVGELRGVDRPIVLTPHPGEFARLTGKTVSEIQADREGVAAEFAREYGVVVVLKGQNTVVTDGTKVYVNRSGNPGMATGGAGDVLTGVIAALIGQGLPVFEAAALGTYAHGVAGDIARDNNGEVGLIAGDIVDALADAFEHLTR